MKARRRPRGAVSSEDSRLRSVTNPVQVMGGDAPTDDREGRHGRVVIGASQPDVVATRQQALEQGGVDHAGGEVTGAHAGVLSGPGSALASDLDLGAVEVGGGVDDGRADVLPEVDDDAAGRAWPLARLGRHGTTDTGV